MNAIEPYARPRSLDTIAAMYDVQERYVEELRHLASGYHNIDLRPMIFDGTTVHRLGPDPVPHNLRDALADEALTLAELRHEYALARRRERR